MVCFDASVLIDLFDNRASNKNKPRLDLLIKDFELRKERVGVPAPAYTEFLIGAGKARSDYESRIHNMSRFTIEPFSTRAATECSILLVNALQTRDASKITKTKFKFDWMIVATAKAMNATCMYTGDDDLKRACSRVNLPCILVSTLPLPTVHPQTNLQFDPR